MLVAQQVVPKIDVAAVTVIDAAAFPDAAFRNWVSVNADTDKDGKLTAAEITAIKTIDLSQVKTIEDLKGIEYFTALEILNVNENKLTSLDISKNTELIELHCSNNRLPCLDLGMNRKLNSDHIECTGNVYPVKAKGGIIDPWSIKGFRYNYIINNTLSNGKLTQKLLRAIEPGEISYMYGTWHGPLKFAIKVIADQAITIDKVAIEKTNYTYTGKAIEPKLTVTATVDGQEVTLLTGQYDVEYKDNVKVGTATVMVTGKGFFSGTVTAITPAKLSSATLKYTETTYTGKALKPTVTVKAKAGNKTVTLKKTDYTVTYSNNTNIGKATVTIKGKDNATGTLTKTFKIKAVPITVAKVKNANLPYNGKARTPILIVKAKVGTKTVSLKKDRDYTATYKNNLNAGTATVTVKGKGNYSGTMTCTFKINALKLTSATATLSDTTLTYTGKALKPKPTVTMKVDGKTVTLKSGTDYTVKYSNNKKVGTATVTITGKGNFTGTITLAFTITKEK